MNEREGVVHRSFNGNRVVSGLNWPLKFRSMVMLLYLRNAVQSAKSIAPDVKNKLSIGFGSLITNLQYFVTDYITEPPNATT